MENLLELSSDIIDRGDTTRPPNRVTGKLSEVDDGLAVVEAFSHVWALDTDEGLVVVDTSADVFGAVCREAIRRWSRSRVHSIVYTHGHTDHVGGTGAFVSDDGPSPRVIGHENVPARFDRYDLTNGYNAVVNHRQFGQTRLGRGVDAAPQWFSDWVQPDITFADRLEVQVADTTLELRHDKGETDDHTWIWVPDRRAVFAGDFVAWVFPNAGNPQKVQRYPLEWAAALRAMQQLQPELLLPAHGLPVVGRERIAMVLDDIATALEMLVHETLTMMNAGARLDDITASVTVPDECLAKPYLRPVYDEPEFVVRNVWRLYGGWYDGNPARLKPAKDRTVARQVAAFAGGAHALVARARQLLDGGDEDLRLACQLVEWAAQAAPESPDVHATRAEAYEARRATELSLMAKGIYGNAAHDSAVHSQHQPKLDQQTSFS